MVTVGLLVRLEAKAGKEEEVNALIPVRCLSHNRRLARPHGLRYVSDHRRSGSLTHFRMRPGETRILADPSPRR